MIGIVTTPASWRFLVKHPYQPENIVHQYKPLAKKYGVELCLFSFNRIRPLSKMADALVYSPLPDSTGLKTVALPRVNIVRNTRYLSDQGLISRIERLRRQNIHFINLPLYTQGNKLRNCEYLSSIDEFKSHVPYTRRLTYRDLHYCLRQFRKVIVKPIYGCKGRNITVIEEKENGRYQIFQTTFKNREKAYGHDFVIPQSHLEAFFGETFHRPASFLVQQWVQLPSFQGRPFDIRAVVQKNGRNRWQVTSRVARVAPPKGQVTNLSQGGETVSFDKLNRKELHREIRPFCLEVAGVFEKLYPWAAEMGLDLAIDGQGKLWYIETNFCPEKGRWTTAFKVPFEYAYYIYTNTR